MIDPRGTRFAATITSIVLVVVLVTGNPWILAAQVAVFAIGAIRGPAKSPYGVVYATFIRPRLDPPATTEDPSPPRFAQAVGLVFTLAALVALLAGVSPVGYAAVSLALAAAFLNAAFGLCLGCEIYLTLARVRFRGDRHAKQSSRLSTL